MNIGLISQENSDDETNKTSKPNEPDTTSVTIPIDNKEKFTSPCEENQLSCSSFKINIYFFVIVLALFIGCVILMGALITKINQNNNLIAENKELKRRVNHSRLPENGTGKIITIMIFEHYC